MVVSQVVRPAEIYTDELSGKLQVDNDEERVWTTTTTTTALTPTPIATKACAEESTAVAPMKQRKFSFKHGKVSESEDDVHDGDFGKNHLDE